MSFLEGKEDITADWREKFLNTYKVSCGKRCHVSWCIVSAWPQRTVRLNTFCCVCYEIRQISCKCALCLFLQTGLMFWPFMQVRFMSSPQKFTHSFSSSHTWVTLSPLGEPLELVWLESFILQYSLTLKCKMRINDQSFMAALGCRLENEWTVLYRVALHFSPADMVLSTVTLPAVGDSRWVTTVSVVSMFLAAWWFVSDADWHSVRGCETCYNYRTRLFQPWLITNHLGSKSSLENCGAVISHRPDAVTPTTSAGLREDLQCDCTLCHCLGDEGVSFSLLYIKKFTTQTLNPSSLDMSHASHCVSITTVKLWTYRYKWRNQAIINNYKNV